MTENQYSQDEIKRAFEKAHMIYLRSDVTSEQDGYLISETNPDRSGTDLPQMFCIIPNLNKDKGIYRCRVFTSNSIISYAESYHDDFNDALLAGRTGTGIEVVGTLPQLAVKAPKKNKEEIFSIRIDEELKRKFAEVCLKTDKTQADVIRGAMRHYIMLHTQLTN